MKPPEETPRWLDDSAEIGGELELGLERMSSNLPSAEQLAHLAARLGVTPSGAAVNGHAPAAKTLLKLAAGVGISGAVLWGLLRGNALVPTDVPVVAPSASPSATSHDERFAPLAPPLPTSNERAKAPSSVRPAPASSAVTDESAALAPPVPPSETPEVSKPSDHAPVEDPRPNASPTLSPERAASKAPSRALVPTADGSSAPARAPTASPPSETALLRDARLALNGAPAHALALTEQHRREYPNGGFAQEREVIAITALARLGRSSDARSRAERFRKAYPTSPYIERVDRAVPP